MRWVVVVGLPVERGDRGVLAHSLVRGVRRVLVWVGKVLGVTLMVLACFSLDLVFLHIVVIWMISDW